MISREQITAGKKVANMKYEALETIVKLLEKLEADVDAQTEHEECGSDVVEWVL